MQTLNRRALLVATAFAGSFLGWRCDEPPSIGDGGRDTSPNGDASQEVGSNTEDERNDARGRAESGESDGGDGSVFGDGSLADAGPGEAGPGEAGLVDAGLISDSALVDAWPVDAGRLGDTDSGEAAVSPSDATPEDSGAGSGPGCGPSTGDASGFVPPCGLDGVELTTTLSCTGNMNGLCNRVSTDHPPPTSSWIRWRASADVSTFGRSKVFVDAVDPALAAVGALLVSPQTNEAAILFVNTLAPLFGGPVFISDTRSEYTITDGAAGTGSLIFDTVASGGMLSVTFSEKLDLNGTGNVDFRCPGGGQADSHSVRVNVSCKSVGTVATAVADASGD